MNDTIKSTIERTRQYWYIDGFTEILTGLIFILLGGINYASGILEPSPLSALLVGVGYPAVILAGITAGNRVVNALKSRYTYPRTGYVQYIRPEPGVRRKRAIKTGVISALISIVVITILSGLNPEIYIVTTGSLVALFMVMLAMRVPLPRFYLTAIWTVTITVLAFFMNISLSDKMVVLLAGCGLGISIGGSSALIHYLTHTQPAEPGAGEF